MSFKIRSVEDHKRGEFYVNVNFVGAHKRFDDLQQALDFCRRERERKQVDIAEVELQEIVIMLTKEMLYESCFAI